MVISDMHESVSYTHLDVYKRQVEDHGGIQSRILWISWIMIFSTERH